MPTHDQRILSTDGTPTTPATSAAIAPAVEAYLAANPPTSEVGDGEVTMAKLAPDVTPANLGCAGASHNHDGSYAAAAHNHDGSYQAPLVSGTNIKTVNGTTLLGSGNLAVSGGDTIAQGTGAAVAVNSTSVVQMASAANTVAAGDTFSFFLTGCILNNSGANATYTVRVTIGATTFDLALPAATATSASNLTYIRVEAEVAVIATNNIVCTLEVRNGVPAAAATIQNNVLAQHRSIIRTSTNNETGSKTIGIGLVSSTNTATQTFTRTRAEVRKGVAI